MNIINGKNWKNYVGKERNTMKENINKILSRTIITYTFLLFLIFILKIVGFNYFGLDMNNPMILKLNDIILKYGLENVWYAITLYINLVIIISITCNDNSKKIKVYCLCVLPICIMVQIIKSNNIIFNLVDYIYLLILAMTYKKFELKKENYLNYVMITIFMMMFQVISLFTRNIEIANRLSDNFIASTIMSIDYILISVIFYKFYFMKGAKSIWEMVHSFGSHLMMESRNLQRKLQAKLKTKKRKKLSKQEKVYNLIFYPFVIVYNLFTMFVIFIISYVFDSVIECIFITLSFWINKYAFGKPFHAKDSKTCFIISSASYIILNKLASGTIGITYLWQVILGVMFSFITSRFVKKTITKLYKGMTREEFDEKILKVDNKESLQYKICYMYYVERKSELEIAYKVGYSVDNIKKIKAKINKKIKEL